MKFWLSFLSVGFLGLSFSNTFARLHLRRDAEIQSPVNERRTRWMSRCECGCEDGDCDLFSL